MGARDVFPIHRAYIIYDGMFWLVDLTQLKLNQYVTVSAKTVLNGTFSITRKTDLMYSSCCGSVVLDFSHARLTV